MAGWISRAEIVDPVFAEAPCERAFLARITNEAEAIAAVLARGGVPEAEIERPLSQEEVMSLGLTPGEVREGDNFLPPRSHYQPRAAPA